jgi:effector-binding domain-containing protein
MEYDIEPTKVSPQLVAAVRARVPRGEIPQAFRTPLDRVWTFLRRHPGLRTDGHNLFLYHHEPPESGLLTVDFGVQVVRPFEREGDVCCVETPSGEAVMTVHRGPYAGLLEANRAIHAWCRRNGKRIGGFSWEIYGD